MALTVALTKCPHCQNYKFNACGCRRFRCWFEETEIGDTAAATTIYAGNSTSAAEEAVKDYWRDDPLNPGDTMDVWVNQSCDGEMMKFTVEVEIEVEYTAEPT